LVFWFLPFPPAPTTTQQPLSWSSDLLRFRV
jgi:hypothetical protein